MITNGQEMREEIKEKTKEQIREETKGKIKESRKNIGHDQDNRISLCKTDIKEIKN